MIDTSSIFIKKHNIESKIKMNAYDYISIN